MAVAKSGTLTPGVAKSETVDIDSFGPGTGFSVTNRSDSDTIWARLDGQPATVAGDDCFPVLGTRTFRAREEGLKTATVSLISNNASEYTLEGRS